MECHFNGHTNIVDTKTHDHFEMSKCGADTTHGNEMTDKLATPTKKTNHQQ